MTHAQESRSKAECHTCLKASRSLLNSWSIAAKLGLGSSSQNHWLNMIRDPLKRSKIVLPLGSTREVTILASLDACHHGQHSNSNSCSLLCKTDQHYCVSQKQRRNEIPADLRRIRRFLPGANPTTWDMFRLQLWSSPDLEERTITRVFFQSHRNSEKCLHNVQNPSKSCTSQFSCQIFSDQHVTCQQPAKWTEHGLSMD